MLPLGQKPPDDRHTKKRGQIDKSAIQAFRCLDHLWAWEADTPTPAFHLRGEEHDRGKADQGQCRPARRKAQQTVQRKAEIDEHEHVDRHHIGKQRRAVGENVEGEAT
jgi:hypothetical protein